MPAAREIEDDAGIGHQRARGEPRLGGWKHQRDTVELDAIGIGLQDQRIVVGTCPSPDDQRVAERPEDRADHARDTAETKKREPLDIRHRLVLASARDRSTRRMISWAISSGSLNGTIASATVAWRPRASLSPR